MVDCELVLFHGASPKIFRRLKPSIGYVDVFVYHDSCIYIYIYVYSFFFIIYIYTHGRRCIYVSLYVHIYIYVILYTHMHSCTRADIHMYLYNTRWHPVQGLLAQRRGEAPETSAQSTLLCLGEHPKTTLVFGTF